MADDDFPFDLYTGSDTGFLKGCLLSNKTATQINQIEEPKKELGITCLAWGNDERSVICTGCKYGRVYCYSLKSASCVQLHEDHHSDTSQSQKIALKEIRYSEPDLNLISAFSNGLVKVAHFEEISWEEGENTPSRPTHEIGAGNDLYCMDFNLNSRTLIATGGKKNPLKIWDITKPDQPPTFTAKNVKNDWLNLHVPVWETKVQFIPGGDKVITGTGYAQIRMYDPSSVQRRPVLEMKFEENPITALSVRPGVEHQVVVGNTLGNIALLDIRKKGVVKSFKGSRGGVTDIKFHPSRPVFASCGIDRFVNCFDLEQHKHPLYSVYMHSSLNCLLFSSKWSPDDSAGHDDATIEGSDNLEPTAISDGVEGKVKKDFHEDENDEEEDVWKSMAVVKTKKRKQDSNFSPIRTKTKK
ncbi:WD repeat-containing protein 74 [Aplysia californica]|uniref:WD repeat-containing protein 74 n=1 Tax=Aplysia californica TaxID=6500 RepID=A0ABM0JA45_APLCA|nr:WD repeat-containing protein 74 [Aplysia californica]